MTVTAKATRLVLTVENDPDCTDPSDYDGWTLYSWPGHSLITDTDPEQFFNYSAKQGGYIPKIGLRSQLKAGTAFILDYFEHGESEWALRGESVGARFDPGGWDTSRNAGLLVWEGSKEYGDRPGKDYAERRENARRFLAVYTDWANGNGYYYRLETEEGEEIDGCGGMLGTDYFEESVTDLIREQVAERGPLVVKVEGEAAWLFVQQSPYGMPRRIAVEGVETVTEFWDDDEDEE